MPAIHADRASLAGPLALRRSELAQAARNTTVWDPSEVEASGPTSTQALHLARAIPPLREALEATLLAILTRPIARDEGQQLGQARRERELLAVFAQLTRLEAFELRRRLDAELEHDALARAFGRLLVERRVRLRAALR